MKFAKDIDVCLDEYLRLKGETAVYKDFRRLADELLHEEFQELFPNSNVSENSNVAPQDSCTGGKNIKVLANTSNKVSMKILC
jgi:hypothetical protein